MANLSATPVADSLAAVVRSPVLAKLARAGYAAKGIVYGLVGVLALMAALGRGGEVGDTKSGLTTVLTEAPLGHWIVGAVGVGLLAYAAWNLCRAILNVENAPANFKGYFKRAGFTISALLHVALGVWALRAALDRGNGAGGDGAQDASGRVMEWPGGKWLVAAVGAGIIAYGLYQLYRAYASRVTKRLDVDRLGPTWCRYAILASRFGIAARGVVACLIGSFVLRAGLTSNENEAGGLGAALRSLQGASYGRIALGVIAAGLAAYGVYMLLTAWLRRIEVRGA